VVATPGGEPVAQHGFAAAVLLDAGWLLSRADLRAGEEALRRWLNAIALVRPGEAGGTVCAVGPSSDRALQALVRVDPTGFAERELQERREARFPPAVRLITMEGQGEPLDEMLRLIQPPDWVEVLGPVDLDHLSPHPNLAPSAEEPLQRVMLRCASPRGHELTALVKAAASARSARKAEGAVRVRVDPVVL